MSKIKTLAASLILSETKGITVEEAMSELSKLSFKEYYNLIEAGTSIVPPSGQPIGTQNPASRPATNQPTRQQPGQPIRPGQQQQMQPGQQQQMQPGQPPIPGAPPVPGQQPMQPGQQQQMQPGQPPIPGAPPVPGQQPMQPGQQPPVPGAPLAPGQQPPVPGAPLAPGQQQPTEEEVHLARLRELAGIRENCSAGATGASAIAIAPAVMGSVKRRQSTDEELKKEYTAKEAPKTIVGDTKPAQASGQLSANLAASGMKSASRINNGRKRR